MQVVILLISNHGKKKKLINGGHRKREQGLGKGVVSEFDQVNSENFFLSYIIKR